MRRKVLSLVLALAMILSCMTCIVSADEVKGFTDVKEGAWYYADVMNAVEKGLINGMGDGTYAPNKNLTYAEAVKLAAVMHQNAVTSAALTTQDDPEVKATDAAVTSTSDAAVTTTEAAVETTPAAVETTPAAVTTEPAVKAPWYQEYVDYCSAAGIITKEYNWKENATRAGYMEIFAAALPAEQLAAINFIEDGAIPDVAADLPEAAAIYKLYKAGVVQGSDDKYSCKPNDNIKRSEVAAILTRMTDASARKSFVITKTADYNNILKMYKEAMDSDAAEKDFLEKYAPINASVVEKLRNDNYSELSFDLADLNGDKVNELIIAVNDELDTFKVIDAYHMVSDEAVNAAYRIPVADKAFGKDIKVLVLTDGSFFTYSGEEGGDAQYDLYKLTAENKIEKAESAYTAAAEKAELNDAGYTYLKTDDFNKKMNEYLAKNAVSELAKSLTVFAK